MIQLRVFGSVELRGDGREIRDALVQPKRLALLVYLAIAHRGAFHRRDSLIGLFWPELDEPRARDALKQALSYLRRALAPAAESVILSRGSDELSLSTQAVWTDVNAFESAVHDGRFNEALEVYRGDLLEGFFAGASSNFDDWLSRERTRLRTLAGDAAARLAEQRERDGDFAGALSAARRAVALSELAEPVFRKLLSLLDRGGDRVGAIRAYEAFVARLAAEYDTEPAAETRELMEEIRVRQTRHGHLPQRPSVSEPEPVTLLPPTTALALRRVVHGPRIWAGIVVAMILTAVGTMIIFRRGADADLNPKRVVVAPFINLTGDSTLNVLGPLIAEGVTRGLEPLDSVEVVSSQAVVVDAKGNLRKLADLGDLPSVGDEMRAGRVVGGSYSRQGDTLRVQARIVNARDGRVEIALDPVAGSVAAPNAAIERVRDAVASALQASHARTTIGSIGHVPTLAAYREFLTAFELGPDGEKAQPHLIKATQIDTLFTLAQYWLAISYTGSKRWKDADSILNTLSTRRDGLSPVERELFAEADAWVHHDWERDLVASRRLLKRDSTPANAGGVAVVALQANRPREALETLQQFPHTRFRVGAWDPWMKMAIAAHMLGDYETELAVATTGRSRVTGELGKRLMLERQLGALAALGELPALRQKMDSTIDAWKSNVFTSPTGLTVKASANPAQADERIALELYAHAHRAEALAYVRHGLEWHAKNVNSANNTATDSLHASLARLLMLAGRLDSARAIWKRLAPRDTLCAGPRIQLAIVSAHLRDTLDAIRTMNTLDSLATLPYAFGQPRLGQARIAAALGRNDDAVRFLRRAMQDGTPFGRDWHSDADFQSLQDYAPFKLLLRPAG